MSLLNSGFELPGAAPGEAEGWTRGEAGGVFSPAVFSGGADQDGFELGWYPGVYLFRLVPVVSTSSALFDLRLGAGQPLEDFSEGWGGNENYRFSFTSTGSAGVETFEWGAYDFQLQGATPAVFTGGGSREGFESGWLGNEDSTTTLGPTTPALFSEGAQAVERFEPVYEDRRLGANPGASTLEAAGHGLVASQRVSVRLGTSGRLPGGLLESFEYYVVNATTGGFQVSLSPGGVPVQLTDAGAGDFYVRADARVFWRVP